ncbi:unnamed protein product [Bursaphelenchus okinawaensis]|uniref:Uncharacterized protein n=1 Tax=Bursaphelenchus okinawaensis TaxID=465554 RepID=A0A811L7L0_9BILA|nr:unnamed protein product [Bursaphelenchus okinawaensis]CAG9118127.1 unnamed protein product [Bursaphelenchus okinawaensis]
MSGGYTGAGLVPSNGEFYGSGYGERVLAPPEIQQKYAGKPAFFDADHGVLFDGEYAYIYQAQPEQAQGLSLENEVNTGLEKSFHLGNGTEGDVEEHRNALSSTYLLDSPAGAVYQ